jgi:hypothetical protein
MAKVWEKLRHELSLCNSTGLELTFCKWAQLIWPRLQRPATSGAVGQLDKFGIDLVDAEGNPRFAVVVQCKGRSPPKPLTSKDVVDAEKSVSAFVDSPYSCEVYVLIHNCQSGDPDHYRQLDQAVRRVVSVGKADQAFCWNVAQFSQHLSTWLRAELRDRLRDEGARLLESQKLNFRFGEVAISHVPASTADWEPRGSAPLRAQSPNTEVSIDLLLRHALTSRFLLLLGSFGSGKTTLTLTMAAARTLVVWVNAATLSDLLPNTGANVVLRRILEAINPFSADDPAVASLKNQLAAAELGVLLRNPESDAMVVIDALDESRVLQNVAAVATLCDALAELRSPLILTTRREHFDATFGNMSEILDRLTKKGRSNKSVKVVQLTNWGRPQVIQFMNACVLQAEDEEHDALSRLAKDIDEGVVQKAIGDLYKHPLFLQMLADAVVLWGKERTVHYRLIIREWCIGKILRDLNSQRVKPLESFDANQFVDLTLQLMEGVAAQLCVLGQRIQLLEELSSRQVESIASEVFGGRQIDIASIVGWTLLIPSRPRQGAVVPVKFFHRVFQEYFLARGLIRQGADTTNYPESVRRWLPVVREDLEM